MSKMQTVYSIRFDSHSSIYILLYSYLNLDDSSPKSSFSLLLFVVVVVFKYIHFVLYFSTTNTIQSNNKKLNKFAFIT